MSRLAFVIDPCPSPVGRLVCIGPEVRDGRAYMAFAVPSCSRGKSREYQLLLDLYTHEIDCCCEWSRGKRNTRAGIEKWGPVDIFKPVHCCHHITRVSAWCKRHKRQLMESKEALREAYGQREVA